MVKKYVLFRVDGSLALGYGHIYRCVTLAESLRKQGVSIEFVTKTLTNELKNFLNQKNIPVHIISENVNVNIDWQNDRDKTLSIMHNLGKDYDWIIVDNYALDYRWEEFFVKMNKKIMVIDDLANKRHVCHIYLNQTFQIQEKICINFVDETTTLLLGEKYTLLRPEFKNARPLDRTMEEYNDLKIHVFFGSTDPYQYSYRFSKLILENFEKVSLKVITKHAADAKWSRLEKDWLNKIIVHTTIDNMAENMKQCNIGFGAPGMATWERAVLGLTGIYLATHHNQVEILNHLHKQGFCHFMGLAHSIDDKIFLNQFDNILQNKIQLATMGTLAWQKIDGLGLERVTKIIMEH